MLENDACIMRSFHSGYCSDFGFRGCDTMQSCKVDNSVLEEHVSSVFRAHPHDLMKYAQFVLNGCL
jgi:hypothetical protein